MTKNSRIWITWETQRRSLELARALHCDLYVFDFKGVLRYPKCIYYTLRVLLSSRTKLVIVQNPSMVLAAIACAFKILFGRKVVVDRHTTFRLNKERKPNLDWFIFDMLQKFTLKNADLTIVTNDYLASIVKQMNGNPFVLPDKLPDLIRTKTINLGKGFNLFMISSFGIDEPIFEAIEAARRFKDGSLKLYISGNANKFSCSIKDNAPANVVFTGYLNDEDFINHIYAADAVMALTTADYCMLCGCYEAIAAQKPLITSSKSVLREYFAGNVFIDNSIEGILLGLTEIRASYDNYLHNAITIKNVISETWINRFNTLQLRLKELGTC